AQFTLHTSSTPKTSPQRPGRTFRFKMPGEAAGIGELSFPSFWAKINNKIKQTRLSMDAFKEEIGRTLEPLTGIGAARIADLLEVPPEPVMGDLAFPCYILASSWKQ